jgi:hypothetical protein
MSLCGHVFYSTKFIFAYPSNISENMLRKEYYLEIAEPYAEGEIFYG